MARPQGRPPAVAARPAPAPQISQAPQRQINRGESRAMRQAQQRGNNALREQTQHNIQERNIAAQPRRAAESNRAARERTAPPPANNPAAGNNPAAAREDTRARGRTPIANNPAAANRTANSRGADPTRAWVRAPNNRLAVRNPAFANAPGQNPAFRSLARTNFQGRWARDHQRDRFHRGIALGWIGPVFWPYAYSDFVDYTYLPAAYDTFWPYAYDDVYEGMFGTSAYGSYANIPSGRRGAAARTATSASRSGVAQVCTAQASGLTDWPIEQIAQLVQPDDAQRAALDGLKQAVSQAVDILQSACPSELPSTPTGRLDAMRQRLDAMRQAVVTVRPALEKFYGSLSDEQKARFDSLGPDEKNAQGNTPDLAQICSGQAANPGTPLDRLDRALHPTDAQRAALDTLKDASAKAADILKANCSNDQRLTAPGRIAAMESRLDAMLQAINTVQPALEAFYRSLNDEQKAAFNRLGARA